MDSVYLLYVQTILNYWVTQKLTQICTVFLRICIGKVAWFAVYIRANFWVTQYISILLGNPEVTANLYCDFPYPYGEGCVICSIYSRLLLGHSVQHTYYNRCEWCRERRTAVTLQPSVHLGKWPGAKIRENRNEKFPKCTFESSRKRTE